MILLEVYCELRYQGVKRPHRVLIFFQPKLHEKYSATTQIEKGNWPKQMPRTNIISAVQDNTFTSEKQTINTSKWAWFVGWGSCGERWPPVQTVLWAAITLGGHCKSAYLHHWIFSFFLSFFFSHFLFLARKKGKKYYNLGTGVFLLTLKYFFWKIVTAWGIEHSLNFFCFGTYIYYLILYRKNSS